MARYIKGIFLKLYNFYKKWGDQDAIFSTCFVLAVLITSTLNLFNAMLFYITKIEVLKFSLMPVGVILLCVIAVLTAFFSAKREFLLESDIKYTKAQHNGMRIAILFMLSTWVLAPIIYKMGII